MFYTLNAAIVADMNLVTIDDNTGYFGYIGLCDSLSHSFEEILQYNFSPFFNYVTVVCVCARARVSHLNVLVDDDSKFRSERH